MSQYNSTNRPFNDPLTDPQASKVKVSKVKVIKNNLSIERNQKEERDIFKSLNNFKSHFIQKNSGILFYTKNIGYLSNTAFKIENELIKNTLTNKILSSEDAYKVWDYLFNFYKNQSQTA